VENIPVNGGEYEFVPSDCNYIRMSFEGHNDSSIGSKDISVDDLSNTLFAGPKDVISLYKNRSKTSLIKNYNEIENLTDPDDNDYKWESFACFDNSWYGCCLNTNNNFVIYSLNTAEHEWEEIKEIRNTDGSFLFFGVEETGFEIITKESIGDSSDSVIHCYYVSNKNNDIAIPADTRVIFNKQPDGQNGIYYPRYSIKKIIN